MEIVQNSQYQAPQQPVTVPAPNEPNYRRLPLFQNASQNRSIQFQTLPTKKIGFVPFKIPEEKLTLAGESAAGEVESSSMGSMNSEDPDQSIGKPVKNKKGPYRKYTFEEKVRAMEILNSGKDLKSVAKHFNIPRRNLLRWRKNGCERKQGGGRPTDSAMEDAVCQMLKQGTIWTQKQIRQSAKKLSSLKNFKASKGWFVKFCRRYGMDPHGIRMLDKQNL